MSKGDKMGAKKGRIPWNKGVTGYKTKPLSEEAKRKISEFNKGVSKGCPGYKHTEEAKQKIIESNKRRKGETPWNKGITGYKTQPCSEERRRKTSQSHMGIGKGRKLSQEHKDKIGKGQVGMRVGEKHPNWNNGSSFLPYCHKFNNKLKEQIRDRDRRTCQLCGETDNGKKLSVHHIHYDKENCAPDLIALCIKCNGRVNVNRDHYEALFMSKLRERGLIE